MSIGETNTYIINVELDVTDNGPNETFSIDRRTVHVNGRHVRPREGLYGLERAVFEALEAAAYSQALDDVWDEPKWDSRDDHHDCILGPGPVSKNGLG